MRKIMIAALAAATLAPVAANAQSYGEVRRDQRELQRDRQDLRDAQRYGDHRDVRAARQELREDRQETREDWRDYRRAHPDFYRGPAYGGPRGYAYRPVAVGYRFAPAYYARPYWVDAYRYRLPRPGYGQQWIRYGNDVVLVELRSGRTLQVFNRFFF